MKHSGASVRDRVGEGTAYCNLGNAFARLGQHNKELIELDTKYLVQHLPCMSLGRVQGCHGEGTALGDLGSVSYRLTVSNLTRLSSSTPSILTFPVTSGRRNYIGPH